MAIQGQRNGDRRTGRCYGQGHSHPLQARHGNSHCQQMKESEGNRGAEQNWWARPAICQPPVKACRLLDERPDTWIKPASPAHGIKPQGGLRRWPATIPHLSHWLAAQTAEPGRQEHLAHWNQPLPTPSPSRPWLKAYPIASIPPDAAGPAETGWLSGPSFNGKATTGLRSNGSSGLDENRMLRQAGRSTHQLAIRLRVHWAAVAAANEAYRPSWWRATTGRRPEGAFVNNPKARCVYDPEQKILILPARFFSARTKPISLTNITSLSHYIFAPSGQTSSNAHQQNKS